MTWNLLRDLLVARYDDFMMRLTRQLGSEELASESLQETWLRLHRSDAAGAIQSPAGYVFRVAMNIAADRRRGEKRNAWSLHDDHDMDALPDPTPDPERTLEARSDLRALHRAIAALPLRTRQILIAGRLEKLSQTEIAERFGISTRMVRIELRRALDHCEAYLDGSGQDQSEKNMACTDDRSYTRVNPNKRRPE